MATGELLILVGIIMLTAPVVGAAFLAGRAAGERRSRRRYVSELSVLELRTHALDQQAHALDEQRRLLTQQRAGLDERRRTVRMPDSGRARAREESTVQLPRIYPEPRHLRRERGGDGHA